MGPKKKGKSKGSAKVKGKEVKEAPKKRSPSKISRVPTRQEQLPEIIADTIVEYLHEIEGNSPIDLDCSTFFKIRVTSIEWTNWEAVPRSLSLENTAYNVILTGTWTQGMVPSVFKGPLTTKYDFAQAHFHWGPDSNSGSDHSVGGFFLPFEVHLVFYKSSSGSLTEAKKDEDGIVIFCYLYKIWEYDNPSIQAITDNINDVLYPHSTKQLDPVPLITLFAPITDDFITYLGNMQYKTVHGVTYIISRETHFISEKQLASFRNLKDRHENPMILKAREVVSFNGRYVFVMNPKNTLVTTVLIAPPTSPSGSSFCSTFSPSTKASSKKSKASTKGKKSPKKSRKSSKKKSKARAKKKSKKPKSKK